MPKINDHCDLVAADYRNAALALLPSGWAWPRDPDSIMGKFWLAVALTLFRLHVRICVLLRTESYPSASFELLPDWERAVGLPDDCTGAAASIEERRDAVAAKLASRGGQTIAFYSALAAAYGYEITIREWRPFVFGWSRFGDLRWAMAAPNIRHYWSVAVTEPRVTWFRMGSSQVGWDPHARITRATDLECLLNRYKPAHTTLIFDYSGA